MDDIVRILPLVLCGLVAIVTLIIAYLWYFVFGKSLRGVLMAGLGILLNRDSTIDINDDPKLIKRPTDVKKEMPEEMNALDFESSMTSNDQYIPQVRDDDFGAQSAESKRQRQELVSSSFADGRFKRITEAISRTFLRQRWVSRNSDDVVAENVRPGNDSSHHIE